MTLERLGKRNILNQQEEGEAPVEFVSTVEETTVKFYIKQFDMVANCIQERFQQKDHITNFQTMEMLL